MTCSWKGCCRALPPLDGVLTGEHCVLVLRVPADRHRGFCVCSETSAEDMSFLKILMILGGFPGSSAGKESACNAGDLVQFLSQEDPLEKA